jgi:hypothetical protein
MWLWQEEQTTRVLRVRFAIALAHWGCSGPGALGSASLRTHTFRLLKQTLGWTRPKIRTPQAANRWTWMILAVYTQLRLARPLAADLRRPWEKPAGAQRLSPTRVRRWFRHLRAKTPSRPWRRNPPSQGSDGHPAAATTAPPHATMCTQPPRRPAPRSQQRDRSEEVHQPTPATHRLKIKLRAMNGVRVLSPPQGAGRCRLRSPS